MNNRELKFRAFYQKKLYMQEYCGGFSYFIHNDSDALTLEDIFVAAERQKCIIQQYTGLQDRDGKEIYEGDIIEHTFSKTTDDETSIHFGSKLNGSVSFCNHLCAYILTIISDDRHNGDTFQLMNHAPSKKIIGNVFENPELLKTNE